MNVKCEFGRKIFFKSRLWKHGACNFSDAGVAFSVGVGGSREKTKLAFGHGVGVGSSNIMLVCGKGLTKVYSSESVIE